MKGDRVEIVIDSGEGTQTYEVAATRAGRRVDITNRRGVVEVSEVDDIPGIRRCHIHDPFGNRIELLEA